MRMKCTCGTVLKVPEHLAGRRVRCPKCKAPIDVPSMPEEEPVSKGDATIKPRDDTQVAKQPAPSSPPPKATPPPEPHEPPEAPPKPPAQALPSVPSSWLPEASPPPSSQPPATTTPSDKLGNATGRESPKPPSGAPRTLVIAKAQSLVASALAATQATLSYPGWIVIAAFASVAVLLGFGVGLLVGGASHPEMTRPKYKGSHKQEKLLPPPSRRLRIGSEDTAGQQPTTGTTDEPTPTPGLHKRAETVKSEGMLTQPDVADAPAAGGDAPKPACNQEDLQSCMAKLAEAYEREEWETAYPMAETACEVGEMTACFKQGVMAKNGLATGKSPQTALALFEKACNGGDAEGCLQAGMMLKSEKEPEIPVDLKRAMTLILEACKMGHGLACYVAGLEAIDVEDPEVRETGLALLAMACKLGEKHACNTVEQETKWAAEEAAYEASTKPVVSQFEGIEWVVSGRLAPRFKLKGVKCQVPFRQKRMCELLIGLPEGWKRGTGEMIETKAFDADGVQSSLPGILPGDVRSGGVIRDKLRIEVRTEKVEISL